MAGQDYRIVVDTREQLPLFTDDVIVKKLNTGDYSIEGYEDKITIERKSASDFWGTMTSGHQRFKQEIERAAEQDYFAIVVETNYTNIMNKEFEGANYSKISSLVPLKIAFTIHLKYRVPIFFCNGRNETKFIIKELFNAFWRMKEHERTDKS